MNDLKNQIWLAHLYGIGTQYADLLLERFGSATELYNAVGTSFGKSDLIPASVLSKLTDMKKKLSPDELLHDMQNKGINFIPNSSDLYPPLLKTIANPPLGLFALGNMPSFDKLWVSVIGTRRPSDYGKTAARKISKELSEKGVVIVSGMADGLDSIAHQAALESGSPTVAVLGTGVDICYPKVNERLYEKIKENGCLISEFPPGVGSEKWHFPLRNRIISGLSPAIVVIEAEVKSGTSITVNHALEQGREVLAVPGNITSKRSEGTNKLIKEGAHVATCAMDVLDVLGVIESEFLNNINEEIHNNVNIPLAPNEKTLYALLEDGPAELDDIIKKTGFELRDVMVMLTKLELAGIIKELPGQKYSRVG